MKKLMYTLTLLIFSLSVMAKGQHDPTTGVVKSFIGPGSFTALVQNNAIHLEWGSTRGEGVDFFTVERAVSMLEFKTIGTVKGKDNSSAAPAYSFTDENPLNQQAYYRLKATRIDGSVEYHSIISVNVEVLVNSNEINSNKSGQRYLKLEASATPIREVRLLDLNGHMVYATTPRIGTNFIRLPKEVKPGAYLLIQMDKQGGQYQKNIMVL